MGRTILGFLVVGALVVWIAPGILTTFHTATEHLHRVTFALPKIAHQ